MWEEAVRRQNPQWGSEKWPLTPSYKRHLFAKLWEHAKQLKLMVYLIGARRTGKSVLLRQIAQDLMKTENVPPRQILWYEFSQNSSAGEIGKIFEYFYREITDTGKEMHVFFDEIQFAKGYEIEMKMLYDLYEGRVKFFMTGSLSLSYKRKMQESMAGRFLPYKLYPLIFEEYLEMQNETVDLKNYRHLQQESNMEIKRNMATNLNESFRNFLSLGRYPEVIGKPVESISLYLDTLGALTLNQDAFAYFDVRRPNELVGLYEYFRINSGSTISISSLAKSASFETISGYLDILELMGLVYFVYNTKNPLVRRNTIRKAYVNSAIYLRAAKHDLPTAMGFATESYVLERLLQNGDEITFWRKREREIDFLVPRQSQAFEVKFRSQLDEPKILKDFAKKNNFTPTVVTLDTWETRNGVKYIPACLF